jgi:hypothetical protein
LTRPLPWSLAVVLPARRRRAILPVLFPLHLYQLAVSPDVKRAPLPSPLTL